MPLKSYKPTSPGRRLMTSPDFSEITKSRPEKKLTLPLNSTGGRNVYGRMTTRHRGGGHKQRIRIIDWKRDKDGVPAKVAAVEYDPNRSARLALLHYTDGEKRYILWPVGVNVGDVLMSGETVDIRPGNSLPLHAIPLGTVIHNVELKKGRGAQLIRCAKCCSTAAPPSDSWATPSTRSCASARPAGTAGRAGGPPCAAWR